MALDLANLDAILRHPLFLVAATGIVSSYVIPRLTRRWQDHQKAIEPYVIAAKKAVELGLGINAGHDLDLQNLKYFSQNIPGLLEVSIGHALISDALYFGLENTVQLYKRQLINAKM